MKLFFFLFAFCSLVFAQDSTKLINTDSSEYTYTAGDHELLLMPTAHTMPANSGYFSSYELFFLNYGFSIGSKTHISIFTLFPVVASFLESVTIGVKQNYWESKYIACAAFGSFVIKPQVGMIGNVFSFGGSQHGASIGVAYGFSAEESDGELIYMLGAKFGASKKISLIMEYTSSSSLIDNADFKGLLSFGIRFHTESMSWELGGIRPLIDDDSEFIALPFLKATFLF